MKKFLLSVFAGAVALTMSADAWLNAPVSAVKGPRHLYSSQAQAPSRAEDGGYTLKFYDELYTWYVFNNSTSPMTYTNYIYIAPEEASQLAGNVVDQISYSVYLGTAIKSGTVFITEDIDGTPVVEQSVRMSTTYNTAEGYKVVDLTDTYTIKEGVGFYFGFTVKSIRYSNDEYPIPVDAGPANDHCGYVRQSDANGNITLEAQISEMADVNLAIFAHTSGDKGLENIFSIGDPTFGDFTMPILCKSFGSDGIYLPVKNIGGNDITSIEYTYSINGGETVSASIDTMVASNTEEVVVLPFGGALPIGNGYVDVTVVKVNDLVVNKNSTCSFFNLGDSEGYARKFVLEEGTGSWCGYCPIGIVGFEYMQENYADDFVGIAVHSGDDMEVSSYSAVLNYFEGFPSSIANRDPKFILYPAWDELEYGYYIWQTQKSPVKVSITGATVTDDNKVDVTVETEYAIDIEDATYAIAIALTQDGIPGVQTNNYAGQSGYATWLKDWVNYSSKQAWSYSHVARDIFDCKGISGSIPTSLKADETYTFNKAVSLSHVSDVTKAHIIAMVLDTKTGVILNATIEDYSDNGFTGIADKTIGADSVLVRGGKGSISISGEYSNAQVYTVSGQSVGRTTGLAAGIYVVVVDGTAHKVAVK